MVINKPHNELTAAGLSGTFTRFPFHPALRDSFPNGTCGTKHCKCIKINIKLQTKDEFLDSDLFRFLVVVLVYSITHIQLWIHIV